MRHGWVFAVSVFLSTAEVMAALYVLVLATDFWSGPDYTPDVVKAAVWVFIAAGPISAILTWMRKDAALLTLLIQPILLLVLILGT